MTRAGADGAVQAVEPPPRYPASMMLHAIADNTVAALLTTEETLQASTSSLRARRRELHAKRDALARQRTSARSGAQSTLDDTISERHKERRRLLAALEELRGLYGNRSAARDAVVGADFALGVARQAHTDAEGQLLAEQQKLKTLGKDRGAAGKAAEQRKVVEACRKELAAREASRTAKEAELATARAAFDATTPDAAARSARDAEMADLRLQLSRVLEELDALNSKRRSAAAAGGDGTAAAAFEDVRAALDAVGAELPAAEEELAAVRQRIFPATQHFVYNPKYHAAIVGRAGATLRQLQEDFGVAVCIDMLPAGHGYVVGGAAEAAACMDAIACVLQDEEAKAFATTLVLEDPTLRRELVGPRGTVVEQFQEDFDVSLQVAETSVTVTGRRQAVAAATQAIRVLLESHTVQEMPVAADLLPALLGRGGRTIAQISDDSGVRHLRVDRERGIVKATGAPEAIRRAFELCRSAMGDVDGASRVVHADDAWVAAVVGPRGAVVRALEEETGARITCSGTTISLRGSHEAVQLAHERVLALRRAERVVLVDPRHLHFLTAPIVAVVGDEEPPSPTARAPSPHRGPSGGSAISPLEAVRRATQCDQVVPLRAEGRVVLRGSTDAVDTAYGLLKLLTRHNEPYTINVVFLDVLRTFMLSRRKQWGHRTLLDHVQAHFASPVRIDVDWGSRRMAVSSCCEREARAAARELVDSLKEYCADHVRIISNFPEDAMRRLVGTKGSTIRKLEETTETEITLVRDRAQVQVHHVSGDVVKLEAAVRAIRVAVFGDDDGDDEGGEGNPADALAVQSPTSTRVPHLSK
ncbi:KH domain containing protein [Novymonas esmeraldas]|uniref:KH domain containing protein n=1 Tax=Novymonas esmeraldas TaxID=1808958 RepID=A0AAW0EPB3_9TRYP